MPISWGKIRFGRLAFILDTQCFKLLCNVSVFGLPFHDEGFNIELFYGRHRIDMESYIRINRLGKVKSKLGAWQMSPVGFCAKAKC